MGNIFSQLGKRLLQIQPKHVMLIFAYNNYFVICTQDRFHALVRMTPKNMVFSQIIFSISKNIVFNTIFHILINFH